MGPKKPPTNQKNANEGAEQNDDVMSDASNMLEFMKNIQAQLSDITTKVSEIDNIDSEVKIMKVILTD